MPKDITRMQLEFRAHWRYYVAQSIIAAAAIVIILTVLGLKHSFIVGSLGSSTFTVFAMPKNVTARMRNVFGGHMIGLACGLAFSFMYSAAPSAEIPALGLAVGLTMFLMVVLDAEHPPAAGTTLGVVLAGRSWQVILTVITSVLMLVLLHFLLKRWMHDLV